MPQEGFSDLPVQVSRFKIGSSWLGWTDGGADLDQGLEPHLYLLKQWEGASQLGANTRLPATSVENSTKKFDLEHSHEIRPAFPIVTQYPR